MYCPSCLVEYREGFMECSDCRVPLRPGLPPEPNPPISLPDPNLEVVTVLEGDDPMALALAQSFLEEAGIPFFVSRRESVLTSRIESGFQMHSPYRIQVGRDREREARELLEHLENLDSGSSDQ